MRPCRAFLVLALLVGCGSDDTGGPGGFGTQPAPRIQPQPQPRSIVGSWLYIQEPTVVYGVDFEADGTYIRQTLRLTSSTAADDQIQGGRYQILATPQAINFFPARSSCPAAIPAYSLGYDFQGQNLLLIGLDGLTSYAPAAPSTDGAMSGFSIRLGCFDADSVFAPGPLRDL